MPRMEQVKIKQLRSGKSETAVSTVGSSRTSEDSHRQTLRDHTPQVVQAVEELVEKVVSRDDEASQQSNEQSDEGSEDAWDVGALGDQLAESLSPSEFSASQSPGGQSPGGSIPRGSRKRNRGF